MTLRLRTLFVLFLSALFLAGCGEDETVYRVDLENRKEMPLPKPEPAITYAYLPQYSHTVSYQRHNLLIQYLNKATGLRIRQIFPDTFEDHIAMLGQGKIDISFSNPFVFVKMAEQYGAEAFARIVEWDGHSDFRGEIICRADNKSIASVKDCLGKSWIAVDPWSAGGYLFPLGFFAANGLKASDFAEISFAPGPGGKQEKVVLAVYAGKFDIGSIREGTLDIVKDKVNLNMIRIVAKTPRYPGWLYAHRKGLDQKTVQTITRALLSLDPNNPEQRIILEQAGFQKVLPTSNSEYEPIRTLVRNLDIPHE